MKTECSLQQVVSPTSLLLHAYAELASREVTRAPKAKFVIPTILPRGNGGDLILS